MFGAAALVLATSTLAGPGFVEVSFGLPVGDDLVYFTYGDNDDDLWLGTARGEVWRSRSGGRLWERVFRPISEEPWVLPDLKNVRVASLPDFGRGTERDALPQDRVSRAQREADLSGNVREAPREQGAPLLASLVREEAHDPTAVNEVAQCHGTTYLATQEALYRSRDGVHFEALSVGPAGATFDVDWVSCDPTTHGHLIALVDGSVFESRDDGESFFPYVNPLPRSIKLQTASFDEEGRLLIYEARKIYRERPAAHGYDVLCDIRGDSVEAERISWAWWVTAGKAYVVTGDGVLACDGKRSYRPPALRFGREPARYLWVDEAHLAHVVVATDRAVYESQDGGSHYEPIFVAQTARSIRRVILGKRPGEIAILTGGQLFRRVMAPLPPDGGERERLVAALGAEVPLWSVLGAALDRAQLLPDDVGERRTNLRLKSFLPQVVVRVSHRDGAADDDRRELLPRLRPRVFARTLPEGTALTAFALWDLADVIQDPRETDVSWVDVDRLRQRVSYRVQDTYTQWIRASVQLADPTLSPLQRGAYELLRREAAAYLNHMTGGAFAAFRPNLGASS